MIRVKVAYKSNKPSLVDEYALPLTEFVGLFAHVTFGASGGVWDNVNCQTGVALPMYFPGQVSCRDFFSGEESNVMMCGHVTNMLVQRTSCTVGYTNKYTTKKLCSL